MDKVIIRRPTVINALHESELSPFLANIYSARGVESMDQLERGLKLLYPFELLSNIDRAVECLHGALRHQEHIMIVGDYDADGATSTALAVNALRQMGAAKVSFIVPNRFEYGYGLSPEIVHEAMKQKPDCLVTVDNGVSSVAGVLAAKSHSLQVVVTDHHIAPDVLPDADAIVNPNLPGDTFPSKNLAGVGVIFYVMLALRSHLRKLGWFEQQGLPDINMAQFLDLVALGTVADVVALDHNNRILVHQGLQRMRAGQLRPGIRALLEVSGRDVAKVTSGDLGFAVGPRLNAAGRLEDMSQGIELLLADHPTKAQAMAAELDQLNHQRRQIEGDMREQAFKALDSIKLDKEMPIGVCLYDEKWHQGVVGILASRVKEQLHRPVIAFAKVSDTEIKGSGRSIPGVHIRDILDVVATRHPEMITKFGGHAMAAGLSLPPEQYSAFSEAFDLAVREQVEESELRGQIMSDGELSSDEFSLNTGQLLQEAGPWGQGFPEPIFDGEFHIAQQRLLKEKHLKLMLQIPGGNYVDAIAFNVDTKKWPNHRCEKVHVAYRLDINEWQGRQSVQLMVEHLIAL